MSETDTVQNHPEYPVTTSSLCDDFSSLGIKPGDVVLVHSSLSALGWVSGGAPAVILALEEVLGADGTLVMPTHSGDLSDPSFWQNPPVPESWWPIIRETMTAYDPDMTPSRGMGIIPEVFRKQSGVLRSAHPHVSFAARGKYASQITENHELLGDLGDNSPLARIYDLDGWVLLLGVRHDHNTSMHLAEYRAVYPGKRIIRQGAPVLVDGKRQWVFFDALDWDSDDFETIGADYENQGGEIYRGKTGFGTSLLFRQKPLVDFAVQWMNENRK